MPAIEIDDEVFAQLQNRARPFIDTPNDVIRRLLAEVEAVAPSASATPIPTTTTPRDVPPMGRLHKLIDDGSVRPGDQVRHRRKRTGEVFEATITEGGC